MGCVLPVDSKRAVAAYRSKYWKSLTISAIAEQPAAAAIALVLPRNEPRVDFTQAIRKDKANQSIEEDRSMLTRMLAAAALVALSAGAQAGTLQNGTWTPNCADPGAAPTFSSKSPQAYNDSAKAAQAYQQKAKDYADCLNTEAKADQSAVVDGANTRVKTISDAISAMSAQSAAAVDKLKKKSGTAASPHDAQ
jgi:hypothetical protein